MPGSIQVWDWIADRFEVFEIHEGGMGLVYIAHDRLAKPGREVVALKTLRDELVVDRERAGRFAAECHLWVQLGRHPNVVQAFAVEKVEGRPHIILELVTGGELRRKIGTPELDVPHALRYGVEFCLGMEHAIRQGLKCHRDIKPANLLLTDSNTLKITDFGLACIRDELLAAGLDGTDPIPLVDTTIPQKIVWADPRDQRASSSSQLATSIPATDPIPEDSARVADKTSELSHPNFSEYREAAFADVDPNSTIEYSPPNRFGTQDTLISHLTRSGVLLGTLPYMAPEQFRDAHSADIRADIYSFGVVLFELLTAELPFKGNTVAKLQRQHSLYEPPSVIPSIPRKFARMAERIDRIVHRCLAKNPEDRFSTVSALRRSLTSVLRRLGHR
jgi:serine/threonine protein kinase